MPRKTPVAARELGVSYSRLICLLRYQKIPAPPKDTSDDYVWRDEDMERARAALRVLDEKRQKRLAPVAAAI
jgi:hypothetical protein